jgi:hypothetical protein
MKYSVYATHRGYEGILVKDVAAKHHDIAFFEPGGLFCGKGKDAHRVATLLKRRDKVATKKSISPCNQYVQCQAPSSAQKIYRMTEPQ